MKNSKFKEWDFPCKVICSKWRRKESGILEKYKEMLITFKEALLSPNTESYYNINF